MKRSTNPKLFLTADESNRVAEAIQAAENRTSAEIKLVLARHCWGTLQEKAARVFRKAGLHETQRHNAVLILLVTSNREFLVYGDRGINRNTGADFWWDVRDVMQNRFRQAQVVDGLCQGIALIGEKLAEFFPRMDDDANEIADNVMAVD